jgi:hypothetical protein
MTVRLRIVDHQDRDPWWVDARFQYLIFGLGVGFEAGLIAAFKLIILSYVH